MLVISDATPLNVLIRAGHAVILQKLFGKVIIPQAVEKELTHPATPRNVRDWIQHHPVWLEVRNAMETDSGALKNRGEREAISLAMELRAELFLVDDRRAYRRPETRHYLRRHDWRDRSRRRERTARSS